MKTASIMALHLTCKLRMCQCVEHLDKIPGPFNDLDIYSPHLLHTGGGAL